MSRLTRGEKALAVGTGTLLGAGIALAGQFFAWGLALEFTLCVIGAACLGALLAQWRGFPK